MSCVASAKTSDAAAAPSAVISRPKLAPFLKDLFGYGLCSAAALGLDVGLLYGLTQAGMTYLASAAVGFVAGMILAYVLSIRFVYQGRRGLDRKREAFGFFAIGFVGLLLNQVALYAFVDGFHLALGPAKALAAVGVFFFNFVARRKALFAAVLS
jgi:putative flippase GtrA